MDQRPSAHQRGDDDHPQGSPHRLHGRDRPRARDRRSLRRIAGSHPCRLILDKGNPPRAAARRKRSAMNNGSNPHGGGNVEIRFGGDAGAAPDDLIKETTTANFTQDVIRASMQQPVLVDFWAPWCGPCRQLTPVLEKVVREAKGAVKLVKMNIDEHPAVAAQLGVQSIPAVFAFRNGQPVDGFMGALPESRVREFIARIGGEVPDRMAEALDAARQALDDGDAQTAGQIYSAVLQQEPENLVALGGLAETLFSIG